MGLDVRALQRPDGSFIGDEWGEVDTRFSYCALNCLALIHRLDAIDVEKAVEFVLKCKNFDEGFGTIPEAESHAGMSKDSFLRICCIYGLTQRFVVWVRW